MQVWDPQFAMRSPMFRPLRNLAAVVQGAQWPTADRLNAMATRIAAVSGGGQPLRFASLSGAASPGAADYEMQIHDDGVVPLRDANWHDLFNALTWLAFPRTKAAMNHVHRDELRAAPGGASRMRNARRDVLTLLDESGVLVLSNSSTMLERLRAFAWKRVFCDERETLTRTTRFLMLGHGLYEKALSPFVGMTGHALLLSLPAHFDMSDEPSLLAYADTASANSVQASLQRPRDLSPLPVLGVPGWWHANRSATFYDNADYFRPGRTRAGT
jgi:hypothetical protein